jgi:cephalosporin-C deacetylase
MALFDLPLAELTTYLPALDEPADLDAFWDATLAEARTFDLNVSVVPTDEGLTLVETADLTFAGFGGHPIHACP